MNNDSRTEKHIIERFYKMTDIVVGNSVDKQLAGVSEILNIDYVGQNNIQQKLDIYTPENKSNPLPVIIVVHGGGWIYGSKENNKLFSQYLVKRQGVIAVSINYRLLPQVKFADQVSDLITAVRWTIGNIRKYSGNPEQLFLVGDSAGGQLILFALAVSSNPGLLAETNRQLNADIKPLNMSDIKGVGLLSPVEKLFDEKDTMFPVIRHFKNLYTENDNLYKSLINRVVQECYNSQFPKTFLMSSEDDCTFRQAQSIANALIKQNIENKIVFFPSNPQCALSHAFIIKNPELQESAEAEELMIKFFLEER